MNINGLPCSLEIPGLYQKRELSWTNFTLTLFAFSLSTGGDPSFWPAGAAISPTVGEKVTWS